MKLDWSHWLYGLFAALIGGGASSVGSAFGAMSIAPGQFGVGGDPGWNSLKLMILTFAISGAIATFAYLKQSPLPAQVATVTETKTDTISITPKDGK
jgi:hypothetical protein